MCISRSIELKTHLLKRCVFHLQSYATTCVKVLWDPITITPLLCVPRIRTASNRLTQKPDVFGQTHMTVKGGSAHMEGSELAFVPILAQITCDENFLLQQRQRFHRTSVGQNPLNDVPHLHPVPTQLPNDRSSSSLSGSNSRSSICFITLRSMAGDTHPPADVPVVLAVSVCRMIR